MTQINTSASKVVWFLVALYLLFTFIKSLTGLIPDGLIVFLNIGILLSIAVIHGVFQYGLRNFLIFFVIVFVISSAYENLSVATGFPFGSYHHAESLGPKLFLVPIIIAPTYFVVGYISWCLALTLLDVFNKQLKGDQIWSVPLVASFVMTMWDLQIDSISSTIYKGWFWHDGGSFFGVPIMNYLGWLLCTYSFFQIFAIYLFKASQFSRNKIRTTLNDGHWYQVVFVYVTLSLPVVFLPFIGDTATVKDPAGVEWNTMVMYKSMALITIFTMWFVAILSFLNIRKKLL